MSSAMSLDLPLIPDPTAPQPVAGIPQQGYDPTPFTNGGMPHIGQDPNDPKPHSEVREQLPLDLVLIAAPNGCNSWVYTPHIRAPELCQAGPH